MTAKLLAAIAKDLDGSDAYGVYGDWLQEQGDPRGELIAIQRARLAKPGDAKLARRERALIDTHAATWFGPLAAAIAPGIHASWGRPPFHVDWHLGFFRAARLGWHDIFGVREGILDMLPELVELPAARFLRALSFGQLDANGANEYPRLVRALVARAPELPHLRALHFGDFTREEWDVNWTTIGKLGPLWRAFPRLTELRIHGGQLGLGALALPRLRVLELRGNGPHPPMLAALAKAKLPALERLSLDFGTTDERLHLGVLCDGRFRRLRELEITWTAPSRDDLIALANGKTLARLRTLSLASCALTDTKAEVLARHAARFAHLDKLDLDNNHLTKRGQKLLRGLCGDVRFGKQQPPDSLWEWT